MINCNLTKGHQKSTQNTLSQPPISESTSSACTVKTYTRSRTPQKVIVNDNSHIILKPSASSALNPID